MNKIMSWLLAIRVKTLSAAVVPVLVGTALAVADGKYQLWVMALALLGALFIQVGTNLFNDAIDFKKGADTEERVGPKRVTQSGLIPHKYVMLGGGVCFVLALACGVPLVMHGGWPIVAIGVCSLIFGYCYTGGPYPLAYLGLGDLFVIVFFGFVAVAGTYYLHTLELTWGALVAGAQVGFLSTLLIAINNLRDIEQDVKANKKTLAVRFGRKFARGEILFLIVASYLLSLYWISVGHYLAAGLPFVTFPFAMLLNKQINETEPGPAYNAFLARASALHVVFGLQLAIGFFAI